MCSIIIMPSLLPNELGRFTKGDEHDFPSLKALTYRITRHDGKEDEITSQIFENYDDAYDLLEEIYGDMCCSDADYEDRPYYEIVAIQTMYT